MIEVRSINLPLAGAERQRPYDQGRLKETVARKLGLTPEDIASCSVSKLAVDARRKGDVHFVASAHVELVGGQSQEARAVRKAKQPGSVVLWEPEPLDMPSLGGAPASDAERPVVVGAGCAGLFCALALAEAGCAPLLVERGDAPRERTAAVEGFNRTGELDPESNIQFGAGGAGTFSDGKLTTGTKSAAIPWVTQAFVDAGADPDILWDAHPHIGSDILPGVVEQLCARIRAAGGQVCFRTRMTGLVIQEGRVRGIEVAKPDGTVGAVAASRVVLACGHSARDVFEEARARGVALERKPFAMGVRVEHRQSLIDQAQYGSAAGNPALPAATYKLSCHMDDGRGVFTFCMCPGGSVVAAASEPGGVVTNGMSLHARDGRNANAALLANVLPSDLPGDDVLAGVALQRQCERRAFELGGGDFAAPAQRLGDFVRGVPSKGQGAVTPTYPRGVAWGDVSPALPPYVADALRKGIPLLARHLHGFDAPDSVLTAVESRSSSPVRMTRGGDRQSTSTAGLFPCGEGAGYAGGIMSAATDGLATARAVVEDILASR